ncbi:MAG: HAD-IIB family hydrolase [Thiohalobacterales bacterium]|nr:HAD-IIB family hydrolase [Thiohalobacterales bacterium]
MPKKLLICTDLDRTLIPNGPEPASPGSHAHFATLAAHRQVELAYVSGRNSELVEEAIVEHDLPVPDFVIGDVGTTIYHVGREHAWKPQERWEAIIGRDWGNRSRTDLEIMLADLPALQLQEPDRQNLFKLSYYVSLDYDQDGIEAEILRRMDHSHIRVRLIWSIDQQESTGLLDIVPHCASKFHAIEALMEQQGYGYRYTVFCGDSGNDLEVLASPLQAVLVANALPEIKEQARAMADSAGNGAQLYIARGDFMGMNGNYSAGMLEGIAHYCPYSVEWMGFSQLLESSDVS